ncbi:hypothetical protein FBZ88_12736 [Nitrospirillum bahiense]|uniref:Uncharacterized protein n=1 Tax=Nitrospirillum amazonense TaxID=28077 RepID=A0A560F604_9PROT|nr:hypothetical protein FBZ88_12736 [Nitrospirillum amazonense]
MMQYRIQYPKITWQLGPFAPLASSPAIRRVCVRTQDITIKNTGA